MARNRAPTLSVDQIIAAIRQLPKKEQIDLAAQLESSKDELAGLAEITDGQFSVLSRDALLFQQRVLKQANQITELYRALATLFMEKMSASRNCAPEETTLKMLREVHERKSRGERWKYIFDAMKPRYVLSSLANLKRQYQRLKNNGRPGWIEPINVDEKCAEWKRLEQEIPHRPDAALELQMSLELHLIEVLRAR